MKSIEQLKKKDLNCNIFSVYDYDGLTITELLCQFFNKINECIDTSNETIDLAKWLVNEGLELEVAKKLMMWLEDGTLENIINVNLFNSLNEKINGLSSQLEQNTSDLVTIKPNGVDDTLQIQEKVLSGGVISFSKKGGVFRVNETINIPSNITIEGNSCKIICSKPICFYGENIENVTIKDLEIVGPSPEIMGEKSTDGCISITHSNNITIDNCTIHKFFSGVSILYSNMARVTNNHIHTYNTYGVMLSRTSNFFCDNNEIHDSIVKGQTKGTYCISATGGSNVDDTQQFCSISNNKLYNNQSWSAIMSHDISKLSILNNQIYNVRNGIDLSTEYLVSDILISNNIIKGTNEDVWNGVNAANDGIILYTGNNASEDICLYNINITGNYIEGFGLHYTGSQACGEIFIGGVKGCNISGNTLVHSDGVATYNAGIFVNYNVSNLNINGNYIRTYSKNGVRLKSTEGENINITGNNIYCHSVSTNAIEISDINLNNFNVDNNITNAIGYYERGTNIINGQNLSAPYGGRGISKRISCRINVSGVTIPAKSKATLTTQTLNGLTVGDTVTVGFAGIKSGLIVYGYVGGSNTVVVEIYNTHDSEVTCSSNTLTINAIKNF